MGVKEKEKTADERERWEEKDKGSTVGKIEPEESVGRKETTICHSNIRNIRTEN